MTNYPLRLPEHVMSAAKALAAKNGASLNQFLSTLIAERVGELRAFDAMEQRAARGNVDAALKILAKVPNRPPLDGDEI
jgi:hypothetical protein